MEKYIVDSYHSISFSWLPNKCSTSLTSFNPQREIYLLEISLVLPRFFLCQHVCRQSSEPQLIITSNEATAIPTILWIIECRSFNFSCAIDLGHCFRWVVKIFLNKIIVAIFHLCFLKYWSHFMHLWYMWYIVQVRQKIFPKQCSETW